MPIRNIPGQSFQLQEYINSFATVVDRKYGVLICKFRDILTHPSEVETALGNLFADVLAKMGECDVMLVWVRLHPQQGIGAASYTQGLPCILPL